MFYQFQNSSMLIIASHVDDLGLYVSCTAEVTKLKEEISRHVSFKDQRETTHLLGIEVIRDCTACTISFSHRRYIDTMLTTYGLSNAHPVFTPAVSGVQLSTRDSPTTSHEIEVMRRIPYQNAVRALNHYIVMTRPDISLAVQKVSQFAVNLGSAHWTAIQ